MAEVRARESAQSLADFYGHVAATWASYGVSFGSTAADSQDFSTHAHWARAQTAGRLKQELRWRVAQLVASYGSGTRPRNEGPDHPTFYASASLLLTQFLGYQETLGGPSADSRNRSVHYLWAQNQSPAGLESALAEKVNAMIVLRRAEGASAAADFYGSLATTWSFYGVDFGGAAANSHDFARHVTWARFRTAEDLKKQLRSRLRKIFQTLPPFAVNLERAWPCKFGDPTCNRCVNNVEGVFRQGIFGYRRTTDGRIEEGPTGRLRLDMRVGWSLPPYYSVVTGAGGLKSHVESIVRLPASGTDSWLVMGRTRPSLGAPFYVFKVEGPPQDHGGNRFVPFDFNDEHYYDRYRDNPSLLDRAAAYVEIPGTKHIGGMQAVGNIVAMPVTCDGDCLRPEVLFWDFTNPVDPQLLSKLALPPPEIAHWVAFTRLESGQYLLIVNRGNDGTTDVFVTRSSAQLQAGTTWYRMPRFNIAAANWDKGGGTYQNANFISGCGTDQLYLLAMRQLGQKEWYWPSAWKTDNLVELFKVRDLTRYGGGDLKLSYVSGATFERFGDYCQMRGGSSVYVEPGGSPVVYCSAGESHDGALKLSEITGYTTR
jgi:hypothetical protein